ncbi:MAG: aminotransferase class I/II-fold pyridoxal phosphate-dependent enzyme [Sulfitobacter sp.]
MDNYILGGTVPQFLDNETPNALHRFRPLTAWLDARYDAGVDPYSKYTSSAIAPTIQAHGRRGDQFQGVNFASQEYLSLSTHPRVIEAAKQAMDTYGVHSAGSAALMGNTLASVELEKKIAAFTGFADCTLFPTGWSAGYGIIRTLVRPQDHVLIDILSHACLHEGAQAATGNVLVYPHLSNEGVERRLKRIRQNDAKNSIVVVTESTFSMDSDVPDIPDLQDICRAYGATLVVDCAHDLGAIGETGRGYLEIQDCIGSVDVLMGSFSKTFASNGGFVATNAKELKLGIRYTCGPHTFSNAMSPVNAATVGTCFDIVDSKEGALLRRKLMSNIILMRRLLRAEEFEILGKESAIVPVILGSNAMSRLITKYTMESGGIVNLIEYPAVSKNTCRLRLQVMANHTEDQIGQFVKILTQARARAQAELA